MFNISIPAISIAINGERRKEFNLQKSLAGPYDNLHNYYSYMVDAQIGRLNKSFPVLTIVNLHATSVGTLLSSRT
jgi:hypothetical protein